MSASPSPGDMDSWTRDERAGFWDTSAFMARLSTEGPIIGGKGRCDSSFFFQGLLTDGAGGRTKVKWGSSQVHRGTVLLL